MFVYVKWNRFGVVCSPAVQLLEHVMPPLATPGTKACDAGGGACRPQWREWPVSEFYASLAPQKHPCEYRRVRRLHDFGFARDPPGAVDTCRPMMVR